MYDNTYVFSDPIEEDHQLSKLSSDLQELARQGMFTISPTYSTTTASLAYGILTSGPGEELDPGSMAMGATGLHCSTTSEDPYHWNLFSRPWTDTTTSNLSKEDLSGSILKESSSLPTKNQDSGIPTSPCNHWELFSDESESLLWRSL